MSASKYHQKLSTLLLVVVSTGLIALFLGRILFSSNAIYSGDTARGYLPQRTALAAALKSGQLPWWEAKLGIGYPLLAEGETGALYPLNWLLVALFPPDISLNLSLVLHTLLCGVGMFLWLRQLKLGTAAAYFSTIVFTFGGFFSAHNGHLSIVSVTAWLPWLLLATDKLVHAPSKKTAAAWMGALALVVALQFLAGHAQISLLILAVTTFYAVYLALVRTKPEMGDFPPPTPFPRQRLLAWAAALALGALLASPQLAASWQLSLLSDRAGGLDPTYFTSFSFHPLLAATFLAPFLRGNPYPNGSVELMGYVGLLPLALAGFGLLRNKRPIRWFLLGVAILGFLLALGRWNPLYSVLLRIPLINMLRVPARFLLWTSLGLAGLAALGLESALAVVRPTLKRSRWILPSLILALLIAILTLILTRRLADELVALWRWLPIVFAGLIALLALALRRVPRTTWLVLAGCLLIIDLFGYNQVLNLTFNQVSSASTIRASPRVADWLAQDDGFYRLYTKEEILPIEFVQKESLYPNYALTYGLSSANLYAPLLPTAYHDYMEQLNAGRLDALNVRYYLIPQLLPVDEASELYDVENPYANLPYESWLTIEPTAVYSLEIESYLSHSASLSNGELAANIMLQTDAGQVITIPIRAGIETAEWAYERPDVAQAVTYPMAAVASTFPARSGYPPVDHAGHTYLTSRTLSDSLRIQAVYIQPVLPAAYTRIEQITFHTSDGQTVLLNHMVGLGDQHIAYRSEDVLVYRNDDARPRAYTISAREAAKTGSALTLSSNLETLHEAVISTYDSQRVVVQADLEEPGYLVLADLTYPGWSALVDGQSADLLTADTIFRAVALEAGEHQVEFRYQFNWLSTD